ncbi:MAG: hypothetical protein AAGA48_35380 [Myxococcota bacterium]
MLIWWSSLAFGAPTVGAIVNPRVAVDTASDRDGEDPLAMHTWVRGFVRDETSRGDRWFVEAWFQHHLLLGQDPGIQAPDNNEAFYELSLGPTGVDVRLGGENSPVRLRAGALIENTGQLELLPVNDLINPVDGRIGLLTPREFQRLPVPLATLKIAKGRFRSETTYVPFATPDRLWLRETDWSILRQRMIDDYLADIQGPVDLEEGEFPAGFGAASQWRSFVQSIRRNNLRESNNTSYRRGRDFATNTNNLPQAFVGDIVQQFRYDGPGFDIGVVGGRIRSRFPQAVLREDLQLALQDRDELFALINDGLFGDAGARVSRAESITDSTLTFDWPYSWMAGADGSTIVGDVALRAEVGFLSDRVVRQTWGRSRTAPQLAGGLGIDITRGSGFAMSIEGRVQRIFVDAADEDELVFSRPLQVQVAGGFQGSFAQERFKWQISGAIDPTFLEAFVRPTLAWRVSQAVELELGGIIIDGFEVAPPETLEDALTYEGGALSYWAQNDGVTFGIRWVL